MYLVLQCAQKGLHSINCNNNNIQFKMLFVYNRGGILEGIYDYDRS